MSKATPIPNSIETRPGGIERANCVKCGAQITRVKGEYELHWWHVITGRAICVGSVDE
jgi:hypothetical protein